MADLGCGPLWRVDGPPPAAPEYGLLQVAEGPVPVVRINPPGDLVDGDQIERWLNGVEVYPYPPGPAFVWDAFQGSSTPTKDAGDEALQHPQFGPMTVNLAESCTARGIGNQEEYKARGRAALAALEGVAVEKEFLTGLNLPLNPHLADDSSIFPNLDAPTNVVNALALLENAIAGTGKAGVIHCTPGFAVAAAAHLLLDKRDPNVLRTINGTVVVAGAGYVATHADSSPSGHAASAGAQEWIYATGPIDIRRSVDVTMLPETVGEAMDRAQNTVTYRVERYYLVDWDTEFKAAVLADRCQVVC